MVTFPALRQELDLLPGPVMADGQPSWTLVDPTRAAYFRIDWLTYEIMCRWSLADTAAIANAIAQVTTLEPTPEDVGAIVAFAVNQQWTQPQGAEAIRAMAQRHAQSQPKFWQQLLHHYLFFRIPLVKPDAWLGKALPWVTPLFSKTFLAITLAALVWGLWQVNRQWDVFSAQLVDTFTWSGLAAYGLAIVVVKILHELGHAFTAKRLGCRVPTMGMAFIVMWPMAYTDTNDTWRLHRHRDRLRVAAAGIATELTVAVWCTWAWSLLPDGGLRAAAFVLATTSWIATVLINASPFMRFDGYFILSDATDMPNLHPRSFAMARWYAKRTLFGWHAPAPELASPTRTRAMVAFGLATLLYRLVLFLGIALMVYHFFFKALGVLLFIVEVYWFIWRPVQHELSTWYSQRQDLMQSGRGRITLVVFMGLVLLPLVPLPNHIHASAVLHPQVVQAVYTPEATQIARVNVHEGQSVRKGAPLLDMSASRLDQDQSSIQARIAALTQQANAEALSTQQPMRVATANDELQTALAQQQQIATDRLRFHPVAEFDGVVRDLEPSLSAGLWLPDRARLLTVVPAAPQWRVETWVDERQLENLRVGDTADFWPRSLNGPRVTLRLVSIDRDAARELARPELAAPLGGHIQARSVNGKWVPEQAMYHLVFTPVEDTRLAPDTRVWRGELVIRARWRAPAGPYLQQAMAVVWRELNF